MNNNNNNNNNNIVDFVNEDFNSISCEMTRDMCMAVRQLGLWEFVRNFGDDRRGFMFSNAPEVNNIGNHPLVERHGHSGASFGMCCRNVQFIAKNGVATWCARFGNAAH